MPPSEVAGLLDAAGHMPVATTRSSLDSVTAALAAASREPGRSVEVRAPRRVLWELVAAAVDEAAQELGDRCTRLLRGSGSTAEVRAALSDASRLVELLDQLEHSS